MIGIASSLALWSVIMMIIDEYTICFMTCETYIKVEVIRRVDRFVSASFAFNLNPQGVESSFSKMLQVVHYYYYASHNISIYN